jgi:hypothetical protein
VKWNVAKMWEDELERLEVQRPRIIKGIEKVTDVDAVSLHPALARYKLRCLAAAI